MLRLVSHSALNPYLFRTAGATAGTSLASGGNVPQEFDPGAYDPSSNPTAFSNPSAWTPATGEPTRGLTIGLHGPEITSPDYPSGGSEPTPSTIPRSLPTGRRPLDFMPSIPEIVTKFLPSAAPSPTTSPAIPIDKPADSTPWIPTSVDPGSSPGTTTTTTAYTPSSPSSPTSPGSTPPTSPTGSVPTADPRDEEINRLMDLVSAQYAGAGQSAPGDGGTFYAAPTTVANPTSNKGPLVFVIVAVVVVGMWYYFKHKKAA